MNSKLVLLLLVNPLTEFIGLENDQRRKSVLYWLNFTNYGVRDQVIRSREKLKPADSNIKQTLFINEDLTKS